MLKCWPLSYAQQMFHCHLLKLRCLDRGRETGGNRGRNRTREREGESEGEREGEREGDIKIESTGKKKKVTDQNVSHFLRDLHHRLLTA